MTPFRAARAVSAARLIEAAGAVLWLSALAAFGAGEGDEIEPAVLAGIGLGAALATAGAAWQGRGTLGRVGRVAAGLGVAGGLLVATGAWVAIMLGILAVVVGTALLGLSFLRGAERRPWGGLVLIAAGGAALLIFGGRGWLPAGFAVGHLLVASLGLVGTAASAPSARVRGMAALAVGSIAALAGMWLSAGLVTGEVRLPSGVTAAVRTDALSPLPVVIDTDMQPDDLLAIVYLASEPNVEIRAVTVAGASVVGCSDGVAYARDLLAGLGRGSVPVACGPQPPAGGLPFPAEWAANMRYFAAQQGWGTTAAPAPPADAVAVLRTAFAAGPATFISLGPATNLARLLADPAWERRNLVRIVQMAGAVDVPGNVTALPSVEWNAAPDPGALAAVLAADVEVVLVSLDGTRHVPMRTATIDRLSANRSTTAADVVARILASQRSFAASGQYYAWDVLAAVAARQPDVVRLELIPLRVSPASGEAGRTVRDSASGRPVLVAVDADAAGFERIFLDALFGRAR